MKIAANLGNLIAANSSDRLVSAMFLVTLAHGLAILGITFAPQTPDPSPIRPTLDVSLVQTAIDPTRPDDPRFLAQVTQRGAGNVDEADRPESVLSAGEMMPSPGKIEANERERQTPGEPQPLERLLVTRSETDFSTLDNPRPDSEFELRMESRLLMAGSRITDPLDVRSTRTAVPSENRRERFVSVDTQESLFARYVGEWRHKVEKVGTLNYPDHALPDSPTRNPILEVAINADGSLREIVVRRTSGHKLLDQAAMRILRLAGPFDAFPDDIRREYDVLRFVYEWRFTSEQFVSN